MSLLEAIVLGIVQGLTEFLPISSTAHLRIVPAFAGWEDPGAAFTAVTQLGTMAAVLLYFRADLRADRPRVDRARSVIRRRGELDARLGWYILLGTIPIGIFGLAFKDQIETGARDLYLIGIALIVLGLVLLAAERVGRTTAPLEEITTPRRHRDRHSPRPWRSSRACRAPARRSPRGCFLGLDRDGRGALLVPALVHTRGRAERPPRVRRRS